MKVRKTGSVEGTGMPRNYGRGSIGHCSCLPSAFPTSIPQLGLGDLVPVGAVRFMTGTEALTGFVLIAWSASFTFVEMERFWKQ